MKTKKEADLLAQERPRDRAQTNEPTNNLTEQAPAVNENNPLRELRLGKEIPVADMVAIVQQRYPAYDKHLQSKAERSHLYGIQLCDDAMDALVVAFAPEQAPETKQPENRVNPCRLVCRVNIHDYNLLMDCMREEGFSTTQDWLYSHLKKYLKAKGAYK